MSIEILETIKSEDTNKLIELFALDILKGLSSEPKMIPSKYFYDDEGSLLFSKIMESKDYYLTNSETEVFEINKTEIVDYLKSDITNIVELGAGDGRKTKILIEEFFKQDGRFNYTSIDISEGAEKEVDRLFSEEFPDLDHVGVVGEYMDGLDWVAENREGKKLVLFLGSTIGNFDRPSALVFLRILWKHLNHGDHVLIGFDLKKDMDVLLHAYNDSEGVTKAFNFNLLKRINRELGADFKFEQFNHFGTYNPRLGAMESYLISMSNQNVYVSELEKSFNFRAFEPIHLEYSYKYLVSEVESFAKETGFEVVKHYFDQKKYYTNSLWKVIKK